MKCLCCLIKINSPEREEYQIRLCKSCTKELEKKTKYICKQCKRRKQTKERMMILCGCGTEMKEVEK